MSGPPDEPSEGPDEGFDRGRRRRTRGRPIPGVRRCETCGTKLSLYNARPYCWQHSIGWPWRGPAAKPRY